ncbi:RNA methyltransferase [soil metagenome]
MRDLVLIVHDIRSTHNVGSLLRTADGFGVKHVHFTGYSPYPQLSEQDTRLPHIAQKLERQISKTALGAERTVTWSQSDDLPSLLADLRENDYRLVALEQDEQAVPLPNYTPRHKTALLIGREVEGIEKALLEQMDDVIEIPMFGQKESFNVVQATAIALYHLRFSP